MADGYDYHFLFLAPQLSGAWLTQAARQYCLRFQPIITDDVTILAHLPANARVAVTLLARPGEVKEASVPIVAQRDRLDLDIVTARDLPEMEIKLNARADAGLPFGEQGGQS
jgi:hypothetical protein